MDNQLVKYCPSCGHQTDSDSIYCLNCGKKLPEKPISKPGTSWKSPTRPVGEPSYQRPAYPPSYTPVYQAKPYHPSMKAPLGERCVAYLIDSAIDQFTCGIYGCIKDGIRDGQSFGKGLMNLRVVDYNSGHPATIGQSFIRNCVCGCVDVSCCYLVVLLSTDGRRIGDQVAGTIVILDR